MVSRILLLTKISSTVLSLKVFRTKNFASDNSCINSRHQLYRRRTVLVLLDI